MMWPCPCLDSTQQSIEGNKNVAKAADASQESPSYTTLQVKPSSAAASEAAAAVPAAAAGGTSDAGTMQAPALAGHDGAAASVPPIPAGPGTALRAKQVVAGESHMQCSPVFKGAATSQLLCL